MPLNANFIRLFSAFSLLISTCRGNNTPAHSPLNYTRPHDVPLDRLLTVDTSMFAAPANIIGGNCTAPTQSLIRDGSLTVILSPTIHENSTKSFDFIQANAIGGSLPYLFEQLGVKADCIPDLVKRGTPLFKDIVNAALSGAQNVSGTTSLSRRGFLSDIGDFFEDVGEAIVDGVEDLVDGVGSILTSGACEVFAASALPGYHASAFGFIILNLLNPPQPTTPDQEFYIHALHGNILQDGIKFYYRAGFPTGFGDAIGVTMGRNVYIRASRIADVSQAGFQYVTETVLHELAHVKQYRSVGYDLSSFGLQYLFNYCKAGFDYEDNVMEADPRAQVLTVKALFDPIGREFVRIWKARGLRSTIGLPTARAYNRVFATAGVTLYSLRFQGGVMFILCSGPGGSPPCT